MGTGIATELERRAYVCLVRTRICRREIFLFASLRCDCRCQMKLSTLPVVLALPSIGNDRGCEAARRCSHYHLSEVSLTNQPCQGLPCFVAAGDNLLAPLPPPADTPRVYCLGNCFAAPTRGVPVGRPPVTVAAREGIVLSRLAAGGARTLSEYTSAGGYEAAATWLRRSSEAVVAEVEASGLRGRGGAGFPTGVKWRSVASQASAEKFVVVNADEGDPGAYIDRFLLEDDPHAIIEACLLAGHAVGASRGIIYLRKEYPSAQRILSAAIDEARAGGWLGNGIANSTFCFDLRIHRGEGSYICGEETALLNSIEGTPPLVRLRPPYPTERGLYGRPTLVNNVETLANIPWILKHGGVAYAAIGFSRSRGTKVVSLNSLFRRPGLYEVEFGTPLRRIVEDLGGGLQTGRLRGVMVGGPLAGVLPPQLLDTPLGFEEFQQVEASVGHGGIVAFDERTSLLSLMQHVFSFAAYESCGKCTPCRRGARVVEEALFQALRAQPLSAFERQFNGDILAALRDTSLCGLGTGLAEFARSVLKYYPDEVTRAFAHD
jgi:NADH:ubiquinone oxidoreductase subunit F (NADH-binding)